MNARTENPKDRLIAGAIALVIALALFLFLFFYMIVTRNPPFDLLGAEGMEMNFGTYNEGTGEVENNGIGDATNVVTSEDVSATTPTETNPTETFLNGEPVVNADPKDPKPDNNNTTVITPVKPTTPANNNNNLLNNFIKGNTHNGTTGGGDGTSGTAGNNGVPDGNPNTNGLGGNGNNPNQIGNGGNSSGYNLGGRKATYLPKVSDTKEEGVVVVTVKVNKEGKVVEAEANGRGTTTSSATLKSKARQAALTATFAPAPNGLDEQIGTITFIFQF